MRPVEFGTILWKPSSEWIGNARITHYMQWLESITHENFPDYQALWEWSTTNVEEFWRSLWDYFSLTSPTPSMRVLSDHAMPGARWFEGAEINWASYVFGKMPETGPVFHAYSEARAPRILTKQEIIEQTSSVAAYLRAVGVGQGDRVAGYLPNIPEAIIAFLACASIGAVWSSCSPDFGSASAIARFRQIEPTVLFTVDGYRYNGKAFDRRMVLDALQENLPSLKSTVLVPYLDPDITFWGHQEDQTQLWNDLLAQPAPWTYSTVPFNHPLWILYSSGTTGIPKAIVQSQGGILLTQLMMSALHLNIQPGDRSFWFTTTGWVMWNALVGMLTAGSAIVLYDGSPFYPSPEILWDIAEETQMTYFGTSPAYLQALARQQIEPGRDHDLRSLRALGTTGSPLAPDLYAWVYDHVRSDIWLGPISGGTDVAAAFVGGCPILPVRAGEMQCRFLGVKVQAFNDIGEGVTGDVGELVVTEPMPSMPIYFWNDPEGQRYYDSYFTKYPGVWQHGDWIQITPQGTAIIYGRSDSTINRHGVRMGSSEIYQAVESLPAVADSLVVDLEYLGRPSFLPLFVVLAEGTELTADLREQIAEVIRSTVSPRHVPDAIYEIPEVPRTLNGKKLEVPIRKILMGFAPGTSVDPDAMANPKSLDIFLQWAKQWNSPA